MERLLAENVKEEKRKREEEVMVEREKKEKSEIMWHEMEEEMKIWKEQGKGADQQTLTISV